MVHIWYKLIFVSEIFEYIRIFVTPLCTLSSSSMICFYFDSKKTLIVCLDICFHIFVFIVTCNLPSSPSSPSTKRKAESRKKRTSWSPITHLYSEKRSFLKLALLFSDFSPLCQPSLFRKSQLWDPSPITNLSLTPITQFYFETVVML